jgi:hypothetical protein
MSKVIESPVKRWPGTITLPDYLTYPQVVAFRKAVAEAKGLGEDAQLDVYNYAMLPGLCICVERWDIAGLPEHVTAETFPAAPARASSQLLAWVINGVVALFKDAEEIPND